MAVTFSPQPPGRPPSANGAATKNAMRPKSAGPAISASVAEILKTVSPLFLSLLCSCASIIKLRAQATQLCSAVRSVC
jgi:hypothetical protein